MPGITVSPLTGATVGSPADKSAVAASLLSLFDTVRNHTHIQSDWENYNKSPTDEEEKVYQLMQDMAKDVFAGRISKNKHSKMHGSNVW
jgi:hypothetical protein